MFLPFITLRIPFTSECICRHLFLYRPFSTCSSLMSFSPFSCFLWLLSLLVACFFLFSLGRHRAPFSLVCATFTYFGFCFSFFFCGPSSTQLFPYWFCSHQFAELGSIQCLAFSHRAYSLAFLSFCNSVLSNLQGRFLIY